MFLKKLHLTMMFVWEVGHDVVVLLNTPFFTSQFRQTDPLKSSDHPPGDPHFSTLGPKLSVWAAPSNWDLAQIVLSVSRIKNHLMKPITEGEKLSGKF